jgi:hypothetical protein
VIEAKNRNGAKTTFLLDLPSHTTVDHPPAKEQIEWRMIPGDVGYVKINDLISFDTIGMFDAALEHLKTTRGLILDLREIPSGGVTMVAEPILGRLITARQPYQKMISIHATNQTLRYVFCQRDGEGPERRLSFVPSNISRRRKPAKAGRPSPSRFLRHASYTSPHRWFSSWVLLGRDPVLCSQAARSELLVRIEDILSPRFESLVNLLAKELAFWAALLELICSQTRDDATDLLGQRAVDLF